MTDHHDFGFDHHDVSGHDPVPFEDHSPPPDDHLAWDDGHEYDMSHDVEPVPHESPAPDVDAQDVGDAPPEVAHADLPDLADLPEESPFPPAVDVGDLPEPVDGWPWIDTGSLGVADLHAALDTDPVHPADLAAYNATDLPPGADPWAALADSDDPATAALAKWWQQN